MLIIRYNIVFRLIEKCNANTVYLFYFLFAAFAIMLDKISPALFSPDP